MDGDVVAFAFRYQSAGENTDACSYDRYVERELVATVHGYRSSSIFFFVLARGTDRMDRRIYRM